MIDFVGQIRVFVRMWMVLSKAFEHQQAGSLGKSLPIFHKEIENPQIVVAYLLNLIKCHKPHCPG